MFKILAASAAIATLVLPAHAVTITQWTFNSAVPDANSGTGSLLPSTGAGTASLVGGTTATFASGDASGGSTDPAVGDDSGLNLAGFPVQGAADKTAGAQFTVSTVGFTGVLLTWDQLQSATASRYSFLQYTVNGVNYLDAPSGLFLVAAGGAWNNTRSYDFSSVADVNNNALFGVRIVSTFRPSTTAYDPSTVASTYGTAGTYRFDMVTFSATPVPEVGTLALMLAGLAAVGFVAQRRR